jgi:hypothetical protein
MKRIQRLGPFHPSSFIPHPFDLARLRTYPQHTRAWLPLLRSRPGGVHRHYVVRSPKSDKLSKTAKSDVRYSMSDVSS